nr:Chain A, ILE-LEU-GLY-SER-ILE-ILE-LEU-GLY [Jatropha]6DKY_B Chain B, ILE-LEU-GLY-SER-ILE-ILE-LEU-GLY [Jatropha]
ILGSIILG